MSRQDITVHRWKYTCDRCGRVDVPVETGTRWAWISGQVDGVADDETFLVPRLRGDICPTCIASFRQWWNQPK